MIVKMRIVVVMVAVLMNSTLSVHQVSLGQTVRQILTNVMVRTVVVKDCVWMESTRMFVYVLLGIYWC